MTVFFSTVRERSRLLGLEPVGAILLLVDLYLVAMIAFAVVRRLRVARAGTHRECIALGLVGFTTIVLPASLLGAVGALSNSALIGCHAALIVAIAGCERPRTPWRALLRAAAVPCRCLGAMAGSGLQLASRPAWIRRRRGRNLLLVGILAVLALYAVLATWTLPLGWDSQTYRLTRVALWLQEGGIGHFETDDWRLNYVGHNADLVMLWLVSFFPSGYPLVHWVQFAAGLLACATVYELARLVGWSRVWRLGAVAALLGMPSVAIQFFTSQTDLFTAATLAAGVTFGLVALRRRRAAEWILAAAGLGLALGAKGTVLYLGPGLLLLFGAWITIERTPWRSLARGGVIAAGALLLLAGSSYFRNWKTYGNPLAPREAIRSVHLDRVTPVGGALLRLERVVWQLLEPASNPLLPASIRTALFDRMTAHLAESLGGSREWQQSREWIDGRLDEDHSSFGAVSAVAVLVGGLVAGFRSLRPPRRRAARVAALFLPVVAFVVFYCLVSTMQVHHFRYFALVAPLAAVVAVSTFADARWRAVRVLGGAFISAQVATAAIVGLRSEYHGWQALRTPPASTFYPHWKDGRELAAGLGEQPLDVALVFPFDRWLAPYLRTTTNHRFRIAPTADLHRWNSVGEFLDAASADVLVAAPSLLRQKALDDVAVLPAPWILRSQQLALRRLVPGEASRPTIVEADGVDWGGWTALRATLRVAGWRGGPLELDIRNPTPLVREVTARSSRQGTTVAIQPHGATRLRVDVAPRDEVTVRTRPPFIPAEHVAGSGDRRELGVLVTPSHAIAESGVFGDGWTARRAEITLRNWVSGICRLDLANPTPLSREVEVMSRLGMRRIVLGPNAEARVEIAVLPADRLALKVEPPYVPAIDGGGKGDARELGVLLGGDLLQGPREAIYH